MKSKRKPDIRRLNITGQLNARREAVALDLAGELTQGQIAKQVGASRYSVNKWIAAFAEHGEASFTQAKRGRPKGAPNKAVSVVDALKDTPDAVNPYGIAVLDS